MNIKIDKFQKDSVYGNNLVYVSEDVKSDASINISKEEDKYTTAVIDQGDSLVMECLTQQKLAVDFVQ